MEFNRFSPLKEELPFQWEEDGLTVTRTTAWSGPGCHDHCGVLMYTDKDGKLVKVEGDLENPFNNGRLCVRCLALPEVVTNPDRLLHPMKRDPKNRGNSDKWERVSWDEAYDLVVEGFNRIKETYGPESVLFARGTGRDIGPVVSRLAYSFGSPNHVCFAFTGVACYMPRLAMMAATAGTWATVDASQWFPDRYDNPEWQAPEVVLNWGSNVLVSNNEGFYGHWLVDLMKRGTKFIVVDPRLTWLASKADIWLQVRPGTDAALALGMLNVIISEHLYDEDFVEKFTYGFDELAARVAEFPPSKVSAITWVPEDKIVAAARMFAASSNAAVQWGLAVDMTKESFPCGHAIEALWTITGNVDVPGGMATYHQPFDMIQHAGWGYDTLLPEGSFDKLRLGVEEYPIFNFGIPTAQSDAVMRTMDTEEPYPIRGMWIQTNNPIACMAADPKWTLEMMLKCDCIVGADLFMTPTLQACADIVLPVAMLPERYGLALECGYNMGAITKVIEPAGEARSDAQICMELGKRFRPDAWPWATVPEMLTSMMEPTTGMTFEDLQAQGGILYTNFAYKKFETGDERADGQVGFNTPTGRVELKSTAFESWGLDPVPYFEEPTQSPVSTPEVYKEYPLVLTTGARPWGMFHSEHRQIPRLREIHAQPTLELHPDTAVPLGIQEGDWVWVENYKGRARQKAKLTPTIDPRVVHADHAWWFPEKSPQGPNWYGVWDSNINQLVDYNPGRSGFGGNYKSMLCRVYKVKDGEM